ncbi:MAG: hypothetical protein KDD67_16145 [Ignavibacteriae bacterium]|nr:hypothetical protein [Ignavibacteriota bacterium]MCB9216003.1 hypothetical protein [Ignavibacteria bacterium]
MNLIVRRKSPTGVEEKSIQAQRILREATVALSTTGRVILDHTQPVTLNGVKSLARLVEDW